MSLDIQTKIDVDSVLGQIEHFVCCHDTTKTYCGLTMPADCQGWTDKVDCAACMAIDAMDQDAMFCPVEGVCSHALDLCPCPYDEDV